MTAQRDVRDLTTAALVDVAEAAEAFVATTSYFRQVKASRPEFEKLAVALMQLRHARGRSL